VGKTRADARALLRLIYFFVATAPTVPETEPSQ
jgi:hypothetical protein